MRPASDWHRMLSGEQQMVHRCEAGCLTCIVLQFLTGTNMTIRSPLCPLLAGTIVQARCCDYSNTESLESS
jgi:hypothetical protein